jgi:hypothetical protein
MTNNHHTPIPSSPQQPANASTINGPLGELDEAITDHETRIEALETDMPMPSGSPTEYLDGEGNWTVPAGTGAGVDGHVIQDEGVDLPQRAKINFVGEGVTVTNEAGGTQVEIPGGGATDLVAGSIDFTATDKLLGRASSGAGAGEEISLTAAGRALLDDPDAATQRATLGLDNVIHPNLLANAGLNLAQRQAANTYTTIADNKYGPDRFRITRENADVQYRRESAIGETGLTSMYFGTIKKITNPGKFHVCQPLKAINSVPLRGKVVTFQLKLKASALKNIRLGVLELQSAGTIDTIPSTLITAWGADGVDPTFATNVAIISAAETKSVSTSFQLFSITVTVPSDSKNIMPAFWTDEDFAVNDTLSFAELDYHIGSFTQKWLEKDRSLDLTECLLHYRKTFALDDAPVQNYGNNGCLRILAGKAGANTNYGELRLWPPMFAAPTVTTYNPGAANAEARDVIALADCSASTIFAFPMTIYVNTTGNASTAVGNVIYVHLTMEAEL